MQGCRGEGLCASLRLLTDICAFPAFISEECCYYGHWCITLGDTCSLVSLANNKSGNADSYCTIMFNVFKILQQNPGPHTQKIGHLLPRLGSPDSKLVILLCQMATFLLNEVHEEMVMLGGGTICNPSYFTDKSRKTELNASLDSLGKEEGEDKKRLTVQHNIVKGESKFLPNQAIKQK